VKTKIFVHETKRKADAAAKVLGLDPSVWLIVGAGAPLMGFRASTIWVMPIEDTFRVEESKVRLETYIDWINTSLRCRLLPGGEIHFL
jgi:hypothetical protein